jgi:hypothetical protein
MTPDELAGVALHMRLDHGPDHLRHEMWSRMAYLLNIVHDTGTSSVTYKAAVEVAHAYMEARS